MNVRGAVVPVLISVYLVGLIVVEGHKGQVVLVRMAVVGGECDGVFCGTACAGDWCCDAVVCVCGSLVTVAVLDFMRGVWAACGGDGVYCGDADWCGSFALREVYEGDEGGCGMLSIGVRGRLTGFF